MSLLDQLWDETLAGPPPEFCRSISSGAAAKRAAASGRLPLLPVITLRRPDHGFLPASSPHSPLSPQTPGGAEWSYPMKKSTPAAAAVEPRSPTVYDWVMISSLDR